MKKEPKRALADCAGARDWMQIACLATAYHALGRPDDALKAFTKMRTEMGDTGAYNYAALFAQWGQPDEAFRWLETAFRLHDSGLELLRVDPMLDPIRNAPQFKEFERRMKLPI
jgi:tetratricopeptide (TPR) repeat protein